MVRGGARLVRNEAPEIVRTANDHHPRRRIDLEYLLTKIGMPPKGGNPALKDEQIGEIVAYLRSLRQSAQME